MLDSSSSALILSAVFDPTIRFLHVLQALIYIAVIVLTRKSSAWGFGAGCIIAVFWNYMNLFVTTFVKAGLQQLSILLRTGQLQRPDLLIAVIAAGGHFLLIIACLVGFLRTRPRVQQWGKFMAGGALAVLPHRDRHHHRPAIYSSVETSIPVVSRFLDSLHWYRILQPATSMTCDRVRTLQRCGSAVCTILHSPHDKGFSRR